ncbi:MAG TPA: 6,7-dimethyl-8-ribityllumazine synthase [Candidatus Dadabacteria bacterium]|jgi:6,7-dimethyl-8-ribityllumazine synthase|nr:6,7-dimethyl-8-ribityllumazine synthase [Candidatus Dadabacteria bacterium]
MAFQIYVIASSFYEDICARQIEYAENTLRSGVSTLGISVSEIQVKTLKIKGSLELPFVTKAICESYEKKPKENGEKLLGVVVLGCIIKGETNHFEIISNSVSNNLVQLSLEYNVPITSGVLTVTNKKQIDKRTNGGPKDRAIEAAKSLLELITITGSL